jgi:hypothetical protein
MVTPKVDGGSVANEAEKPHKESLEIFGEAKQRLGGKPDEGLSLTMGWWRGPMQGASDDEPRLR